jgi:hypothetical protein
VIVTPAAARASYRALVTLCRQRVAERFVVRLSWLALIGAVAIAFVMGVTMGRASVLTDLVPVATRWLIWLCATPILFVVASWRAQTDRTDGIDTLTALHGVSPRMLSIARAAAAMIEISWRMALLTTLLCASLATIAPSLALLVQGVGLLLFAAAAGLVLGGIGSACGHWGRMRGRALLALVVIAPWVVSDIWVQPGWSIPGMLDAGLAFLTDVSDMVGRR